MKGRIRRAIVSAFGFVLALTAISVGAHHGSAISYDTQNLWTTWATVTQFNYANPHPTMTFDRTVQTAAPTTATPRAASWAASTWP